MKLSQLFKSIINHEDIAEGMGYTVTPMFTYGKAYPLNPYCNTTISYFVLNISRKYGSEHHPMYRKEVSGCWYYCLVYNKYSFNNHKFSLFWVLDQKSEFIGYDTDWIASFKKEWDDQYKGPEKY